MTPSHTCWPHRSCKASALANAVAAFFRAASTSSSDLACTSKMASRRVAPTSSSVNRSLVRRAAICAPNEPTKICHFTFLSNLHCSYRIRRRQRRKEACARAPAATWTPLTSSGSPPKPGSNNPTTCWHSPLRPLLLPPTLALPLSSLLVWRRRLYSRPAWKPLHFPSPDVARAPRGSPRKLIAPDFPARCVAVEVAGVVLVVSMLYSVWIVRRTWVDHTRNKPCVQPPSRNPGTQSTCAS